MVLSECVFEDPRVTKRAAGPTGLAKPKNNKENHDLGLPGGKKPKNIKENQDFRPSRGKGTTETNENLMF